MNDRMGKQPKAKPTTKGAALVTADVVTPIYYGVWNNDTRKFLMDGTFKVIYYPAHGIAQAHVDQLNANAADKAWEVKPLGHVEEPPEEDEQQPRGLPQPSTS